MTVLERNGSPADAETDAKPGAEQYRILDPVDETGRMTVQSADGTTYTVVGGLDGRIRKRLAGRPTGATVRMELTPAPSGTGYVVGRVLPGGLPAF